MSYAFDKKIAYILRVNMYLLGRGTLSPGVAARLRRKRKLRAFLPLGNMFSFRRAGIRPDGKLL